MEIYLIASGSGGQETFTGGKIYGREDDLVAVRALVRGGAGMRLRVLSEAGELTETRLEQDEQTVQVQAPIGAHDEFVRAEVRGADRTDVLPGP